MEEWHSKVKLNFGVTGAGSYGVLNSDGLKGTGGWEGSEKPICEEPL